MYIYSFRVRLSIYLLIVGATASFEL